MKVMACWKLSTGNYKECIARFLKTGGMPAAGVTLLGRWHGMGKGWALAEADNEVALMEWLAQWGDMLEFEVTPVIDDAQAAGVMSKLV